MVRNEFSQYFQKPASNNEEQAFSHYANMYNHYSQEEIFKTLVYSYGVKATWYVIQKIKANPEQNSKIKLA